MTYANTPAMNALVAVVEAALRAEVGVRTNQQQNKPTGYYAERRAGFVGSAAHLCVHLYGAEYEVAKNAIAQGLKLTEKASVPEILRTINKAAKEIALLGLLSQ